MAQQKGGRKLRRCGKDSGYYQAQFYKTEANKLRRAKRRKYLASTERAAERKVIRLAKAEAKRIANLSKRHIKPKP